MDIFTCEDHQFLLVVDMSSRFPVVRILPNETTKSVLNALKGVYSDFGLARRVLTDNGPCFRSHEFIDFHARLSVSVEKSNVYNPQSVGSVERMVQTIKQILVKNTENAWLAILIFRSTDIPGVNRSPSEILNGHKYRTNLPMIDLHHKLNESEIEKMVEKRMSKPTTGVELPKIPVGTPILYDKNPDSTKKKHPNWGKGTVKDRLDGRKYEILMDLESLQDQEDT